MRSSRIWTRVPRHVRCDCIISRPHEEEGADTALLPARQLHSRCVAWPPTCPAHELNDFVSPCSGMLQEDSRESRLPNPRGMQAAGSPRPEHQHEVPHSTIASAVVCPHRLGCTKSNHQASRSSCEVRRWGVLPNRSVEGCSG